LGETEAAISIGCLVGPIASGSLHQATPATLVPIIIEHRFLTSGTLVLYRRLPWNYADAAKHYSAWWRRACGEAVTSLAVIDSGSSRRQKAKLPATPGAFR
jgi:hypothetical protein